MDLDALTRSAAFPSDVTTAWLDVLDVLADHIAEYHPHIKLPSDLKLMWEHHKAEGRVDLRDYHRLRAYGWARSRHVAEFIRVRLHAMDQTQSPWRIIPCPQLPTVWLPLKDWRPLAWCSSEAPSSGWEDALTYTRPIQFFAYNATLYPIGYVEFLFGRKSVICAIGPVGARGSWSAPLSRGDTFSLRGVDLHLVKRWSSVHFTDHHVKATSEEVRWRLRL